MKKPTDRKALVVSALLTALVLILGATAVFAWDRISSSDATRAGDAAADASVSLPAAPALTGKGQALANRRLEEANAEIAAYKAQLEQATQALNDAYAQINALQAAQNQRGPGRFFGEDEGHEHEEGEHGGLFIFQGGGNG